MPAPNWTERIPTSTSQTGENSGWSPGQSRCRRTHAGINGSQGRAARREQMHGHRADGRDPQGPVDRDVGRGAQGLGVHRPALRHGGGLLLPGRHPRRPAAAARRRLLELARPAGPALRRPRRDLAGDAGRRGPVPRGHRRHRRAGLAAGRPGAEPGVVYAGTEPGAVFRSTDGGETFALERRCGTTRTAPQWNAGFGGQAFHTVLPAPHRPALGHRGAVDRRRLPDQRRRRLVGSRATRASARSSCPRASSTPSSASACTRSTRHPARPERLYLQNHGGVYRSDDHGAVVALDRRRAARRVRLPDRGAPARPRHGLRVPDQRRRPALPAATAKARVWRSRDAGETWEELGEGLPDGFFVAVMRDAMCADDHEPRRPLLRRPQRRGLGLGRRGRDLAPARRRPARRDVRPGRRDLIATARTAGWFARPPRGQRRVRRLTARCPAPPPRARTRRGWTRCGAPSPGWAGRTSSPARR